jgi:proteasome assembly chaperone (PAC2) family protein
MYNAFASPRSNTGACVKQPDVRYAIVTDAGLTVLATHCPKLEDVCLMGCALFTAEAVRALVEKCKHLIQLILPTRLSYQRQHKFQAGKLHVHYSG